MRVERRTALASTGATTRRGSARRRLRGSISSLGKPPRFALRWGFNAGLFVQYLVEQSFSLTTADTTLSGDSGQFSELRKSLGAGLNGGPYGSIGHGMTAANVHRDLLSVLLSGTEQLFAVRGEVKQTARIAVVLPHTKVDASVAPCRRRRCDNRNRHHRQCRLRITWPCEVPGLEGLGSERIGQELVEGGANHRLVGADKQNIRRQTAELAKHLKALAVDRILATDGELEDVLVAG